MYKELYDQLPHPFKKPPKYTPIMLWRKFGEYLSWLDAHEWKETQSYARTKGATKKVEDIKEVQGQSVTSKTVRCPNIENWQNFAGIANWRDYRHYWCNHEDPDTRKKYSTVIQRIDSFIRGAQIEGAMIGKFNANIVSRVNSIADSLEQNLSGEIKTNQPQILVTSETAKKALEQIFNED